MKKHLPGLIRIWHGVEIALFPASILLPAPLVSGAPTSTWTHETFEDFSRGWLGNDGNNIYITSEGRIEIIQRWDLNEDGYLDLVFNNTHDNMAAIPASLVEVDATGKVSFVDLDVLGSESAVVSDFNRDGYCDIAFMPNQANVQGSPRYYVTVFYGSPDGWAASRAQRPFPVNRPYAIEQADLDRDGWPDLILAENYQKAPNHLDGYFLSVFWGSEDGFKVDSFSQFEIDHPFGLVRGDFDGDGGVDVSLLAAESTLYTMYAKKGARQDRDWKPTIHTLAEKEGDLNLQAVASADIDGDGALDLIFGSSDPFLFILHGAPGREWGILDPVDAFPATQVTVGDIDEDGRPDLVLTDLGMAYALGGEASGARVDRTGAVRILWGDVGGYAADRMLKVNIASAIHTAIGEFNGDGRPDLAIAVHQGTVTTEVDSLIYFGAAARQLNRAAGRIPTRGATQAVVVSGSNGASDRVVFTNSLAATLGEAVPVYLYWGSSEGFSPDNRSTFPNRSGYDACAADLNLDGHVDFVFVDSGHAGPAFSENDPGLGVHIYWGGNSGTTPGPNKFDLSRRTIFREEHLVSVSSADLNRDGHLDLILGAFSGPDLHSELVIYYGSEDGFSENLRAAIPVTGRCMSPIVADLNEDHWLDLTVSAFETDTLWTFFGGPEGFSTENRSRIYASSPIDIEAADLNADGYLDLVAASYYEKTTGLFDMGNRIFWGSASGYTVADSQWLPGGATVGLTVADLDADGHLDLFCPNYHATTTRERIPSFLFWGDPDGFSSQRRTIVIADSVHDAQVADFNRDGLLDLVLSEHSSNNGHLIDSEILFNDGNRFTNPGKVRLPTMGSHFMWTQDMGNLYHRRFEEIYRSEVLSWDRSCLQGELTVQARIPSGSSLRVEVRSAADHAALRDAFWRSVNESRFTLGGKDRMLQYRLVLGSQYGDLYPSVDRVQVTIKP